MRSPEASAGRCCSSPVASSAVVAMTALVRKGVGATVRPSSSRTTAASRALAPTPPRDSGTSSPAGPSCSASARHRALTSASGSSARRAGSPSSRARCRVERTLERSDSSTSV
uniref:Uncharacterized protein n=1 Tax=Janibacter limosus TaxID=53458 RepID=A0AC61U5W8_9MICO|nr:hypothetical protein [Janibacter limosus]